ncbi:hypothetical protein M231_02925 [Tremella mesenterica]|uniref:Uncharacterized protein n=1 Tax=Tremella mesenterica TaxID=5217 RepID=A0A4Q1BPP5_TREME|nr:hypothetical protein M231_02925 [Tremella mesenterica]
MNALTLTILPVYEGGVGYKQVVRLVLPAFHSVLCMIYAQPPPPSVLPLPDVLPQSDVLPRPDLTSTRSPTPTRPLTSIRPFPPLSTGDPIRTRLPPLSSRVPASSSPVPFSPSTAYRRIESRPLPTAPSSRAPGYTMSGGIPEYGFRQPTLSHTASCTELPTGLRSNAALTRSTALYAAKHLYLTVNGCEDFVFSTLYDASSVAIHAARQRILSVNDCGDFVASTLYDAPSTAVDAASQVVKSICTEAVQTLHDAKATPEYVTKQVVASSVGYLGRHGMLRINAGGDFILSRLMMVSELAFHRAAHCFYRSDPSMLVIPKTRSGPIRHRSGAWGERSTYDQQRWVPGAASQRHDPAIRNDLVGDAMVVKAVKLASNPSYHTADQEPIGCVFQESRRINVMLLHMQLTGS